MKQYLFVYGTLSKSLAPPEIAPIVRDFKYVGAGFINGQLYDLGDFPGAILDEAVHNKVYGKIYELPTDSKTLDALDEYEEYYPRARKKSLFVRKQAIVSRSNKKPLKAWVYEYNGKPKSSKKIASGNYSKAAA